MARVQRVEERRRGEVRKPEGGYRFVSVTELAMVWSAYTAGLIRFIDLRVYFACHELLARRCGQRPQSRKRFSQEEIRRLCGGSKAGQGRAPAVRIHGALSRLEGAGLISWSEHELVLKSDADVFPGAATGLLELLEKLPSNRRLVPFPRRTLRLVAAGCGRAKTATILGHLVRCVYSRRDRKTGETQLTATGACKASWIAEAFSVSLRAVKAARVDLERIGWLRLEAASQWYLNRYGKRAEVNLEWSHKLLDAPGAPIVELESAPLRAVFAPGSAPPDSNKNLLTEYKNQEPACAGSPPAASTKTASPRAESDPRSSGFWSRERAGDGGPEAAQRPTLRNVLPADLRDTARLLVLFEDAQRTGFASSGENERLQFVALAEHARAVGRDPCRLFSALVRRKLFGFITQDDEDSAGKRLKAHLYGGNSSEKPSSPATHRAARIRPGPSPRRASPATPAGEPAGELRPDIARALERIRVLARERQRGAA